MKKRIVNICHHKLIKKLNHDNSPIFWLDRWIDLLDLDLSLKEMQVSWIYDEKYPVWSKEHGCKIWLWQRNLFTLKSTSNKKSLFSRILLENWEEYFLCKESRLFPQQSMWGEAPPLLNEPRGILCVVSGLVTLHSIEKRAVSHVCVRRTRC